MSQVDLNTINDNISIEKVILEHNKDIQVVNTSKDSDNTWQSENQHSTDDQNSSREIQKVSDSCSKEEKESEEDKLNQDESNSSLFVTDAVDTKTVSEDKEQKQEQQHLSIEDQQEGNENKQLQSQQQEIEESCLLKQDQEVVNEEQTNKVIETTLEQIEQTEVQTPIKQFEVKTTEQIRKESREQDERMQELIRQTQASIQNTLDSTDRTLKSVAKTMKEIDETNKKFDQFNNLYEKTMGEFGQKLAEKIRESNLENEDDFIPQITDIEELAQTLKYKNEAVFVLGKSLLNLEKHNLQSQEFFEEQSNDYWKVYGIVKEGMQIKGSHEIDNSIVSIVNSLQEASVSCTLITTSIADGLRGALYNHLKKDNQQSTPTDNILKGTMMKSDYNHNNSDQEEEDEEEMILDKNQMNSSNQTKYQDEEEKEEQKSSFKEMKEEEKLQDQFDFDVFSGKYNYFQINGNLNFIRCSNQDCENKNKPQYLQSYGPIFDKPVCSLCKSPMRPHLKFAEDVTDENVYNIDWVKAKINQLDCLVLVGLDENEKVEPLYQELIQKSIEHGILIVEISIMPTLEIGYIRQLIGHPEELLIFLRDQFIYG